MTTHIKVHAPTVTDDPSVVAESADPVLPARSRYPVTDGVVPVSEPLAVRSPV